MTVDDFREDLTPGQVLARELRYSQRALERNEQYIADAEAQIAGWKLESAAQRERQAALQAAIDRLS